jgi:hypothetical protein
MLAAPRLRRLRAISLSCLLATLVVHQTPVQAQSVDPATAHSPVSMERIRAALEREPAFPNGLAPSSGLAPTGDTPTFRVKIQALLAPVQEDAFDPTFGLPSVGELMMAGIERIRSAAARSIRNRAQRRAQKEVADALAAFCAARGC